MTNVANLSVRPPGRPDQPAATRPPASPPPGRPASSVVAVEPDDVLDAGPPPVSHESVKGLVLGAANILHQMLAARFEERPNIAVMTDDEADRIAGALVSMSARNDGLRQILARSDAASLALVLSGYSGRIVNDVREARRIRRETLDNAEPRSTRANPSDPRPTPPAGSGVDGISGGSRNAGGYGGGLLRADG